MSLKVEYAPEAEETLILVYEFILGNFGKRSAESFLAKAEKIIKLIAELPHMYKASPFDENVRIGLITKQTSVFYRVTQEKLELLFFWDNRQEPI